MKMKRSSEEEDVMVMELGTIESDISTPTTSETEQTSVAVGSRVGRQERREGRGEEQEARSNKWWWLLGAP